MRKIDLVLCCLAFLLFLVVPSQGDWCVARTNAPDSELQPLLDFCCSHVDCSAVQPGGSCFEPDTVAGHASWALNQYYRAKGICLQPGGAIAITTPSYGSCQYPPK
ncbi:major pollen allergen Ole e 10-like [Actinidia eriantha]|uniref:major pollen allergen Ole e 10-like n=1 Tax=Actinidia eriantha TaxID=165200 RepID=UPI0025875E8B|nr:major pollen allergen Ole e 10-like [Actinidia eriantha]